MDALAAPASAVAMDMDENPDQHEGLASSGGAAVGREDVAAANADNRVDEEGDDEAPAVRDAEAVDPKVSKTTRVLRNMPRAPPITLSGGHADSA